MAYAVEIAQAMSLYHITGIRIYDDVTWLANVETRFSFLTIMGPSMELVSTLTQ